MLSREEYVRQSVSLNLFFLRIIKEHLIFAASAFTLRDVNLIQNAIQLKNQFEQLIAETLKWADGLVGPDVIASRQLVTPYTLAAEQVTQFYTSIPINMALTQAELALVPGAFPADNIQELEQRALSLNQQALALTDVAIQTKTMVLNNVLKCQMFTHIYPTMLRHVIEEAQFYRMMLLKLQNRDDMIDTVREMLNHEVFWNHIMSEHGQFIHGMLDPSEKALIEMANQFACRFHELMEEAQRAYDRLVLFPRVTAESLQATASIRDFKAQGTQGSLSCRIQSVMLPLLADHVLREASHYLRLLEIFSRR